MNSCPDYLTGTYTIDKDTIKLYISEINPHCWSYSKYKVIFKIKNLQKKDYRIQLNNMPEKMITADGEVRELKNGRGEIDKLPNENLETDKKDEISDWKTYRNEEYRFEVKYPEEAFATQAFQPKTKVIQCDYVNFANNCPTERIIINGMPFCLQETSKKAPGLIYITYNYTTVRDRECFVVFFTIVYPDCSNYYLPIENQEYDKCRLNNEVIKSKTINQILSTFKFIEK